jgi:hypothetical protein
VRVLLQGRRLTFRHVERSNILRLRPPGATLLLSREKSAEASAVSFELPLPSFADRNVPEATSHTFSTLITCLEEATELHVTTALPSGEKSRARGSWCFTELALLAAGQGSKPD